MGKSESGQKGGSSRSEAKQVSSSQNLAKARVARLYKRRALPFPVLWLLDVLNGASDNKYDAEFFMANAGLRSLCSRRTDLPDKLDPKAVESLRRSWAEAPENKFMAAVLEQGVKYEKIAYQLAESDEQDRA